MKQIHVMKHLTVKTKYLYTPLCTANSVILSQIIPTMPCFHIFLNTLTWSEWTLLSKLKYINYFINWTPRNKSNFSSKFQILMISLDGTIQLSFISFDLYEIAKWFTKCISKKRKKSMKLNTYMNCCGEIYSRMFLTKKNKKIIKKKKNIKWF